MHYKTNRQNHDFQIVHFLAGACHTADAAWSLLQDLKEDRQMALDAAAVASLRAKAKLIRAQEALDKAKRANNEADKLEAQADLLEIESSKDVGDKCIAAAQDELATINAMIAKLEPLRKFSHLDDAQAHEAAQAEEWKLQLVYNAENHILASRTGIAADQIATMRYHPEFKSFILPKLDATLQGMHTATVEGSLQQAPFLLDAPAYELPQLEAPK